MLPVRFHIVYATQSSQARRLAEDVQLNLLRANLSAKVSPIDALTPTVCIETRDDVDTVLLFIIATASQGEVPLMARAFFASLQEVLKDVIPSKLRQYSVFGLGDSKYRFYNHGAKKFIKRLSILKLNEFNRPALGDDSHAFGPLGELDVWLSEIKEKALKYPPMPSQAPTYPPMSSPALTYPPMPSQALTYPPMPSHLQDDAPAIEEIRHMTKMVHQTRAPKEPERLSLEHYSTSQHHHEARILCNYRMTSSHHFQDVRYLRLDLQTVLPKLGDIISIWPSCPTSKVTQLCSAIGIDNPDDIFITERTQDEPTRPAAPSRLKSRKDLNLPSHFYKRTLADILHNIIDINSIPSRAFLYRFSNLFSGEGPHKRRLRDLSSTNANGIQAYMDYVIHEKRSISEIVIDFSLGLQTNSTQQVNKIVSFLLNHVPKITPRLYSVASAPHWHDYLLTAKAFEKRFHLDSDRAKSLARDFISRELKFGRRSASTHAELCIAVKKEKTFLQRKIEGLCSTYLANLKVGDSVHVRVIPGPVDLSWISDQESQLLLGCGTGVAPLRSLMQHFYLSNNLRKSQTILLGFRHPQHDFLFKHDLTKEICDTNIHVKIAWSRLHEEGDETRDRHYIQRDLANISQYQDIIRSEKTVILIAGRSHPMPKEILGTIDKVVGSSAMTTRKLREGRLAIDTWG